MPITKTSPLMGIALNSKMRIHERIKAIKESDGNNKISSEEEAKAILAIPYSHLVWSDSKEALTSEKMNANYYLRYGNKCLADDLADLYKYCKQKGEVLVSKLVDLVGPSKTTVAQK